MNEELRERLIRAWIGQDTDPDVAAAYWDDSAASVDVILAEIEAAGYAVVPMAKYLDEARAALEDAGWVIVSRDRFDRLQMEAIAAVGMRGGVAKWAQPGDLEPLP